MTPVSSQRTTGSVFANQRERLSSSTQTMIAVPTHSENTRSRGKVSRPGATVKSSQASSAQNNADPAISHSAPGKVVGARRMAAFEREDMNCRS